MQFRIWIYFFILALTLVSFTGASTSATPPFTNTVPDPGDTLKSDDPHQSPPVFYTKKIALALSGGGARGFAQVGVLQAFEEENIPVDLIVGTSIGALVGGFYAAGYSATELKRLILSTDWEEIFFDRPARTSLFLTQKRLHGRHILQLRFRGIYPEIPLGLTPGHELTQRLMGLIERAPYHPYPDFDHLKFPFRAIATDIHSGKKVVFRDGNLITALRASMSMPLIFTPLEHNGMLLVDGGVRENIPVETARHEGSGIVIAVNTSAPAEEHQKPQIPWEIADRVTTIMQQEDNQANLDQADIVITPDVSNISSTDFSNLDKVVDAGYRAAKAKIPEIRAILDSLKISILTSCLHGDIWEIKSIEIQGNSLISDGELADLFQQELPCKRIIPEKQQLYKQLYRQRILARYRAIGATQARIDDFIHDDTTGQLTVVINEGIITGIRVEGLKRVHRWGILREFPLTTGDIFLVDAVERGIRQIYGSDLFETAFMVTEPTTDGVEICIRVKEKKTRILRWGARADLERYGQTFMEFIDDNLFGIQIRLVLFGKYGEKDEHYRTSLISDRLFRSYLSLEVGGYLHREEWYHYDLDHEITGGYDFETTGGRFALGIQAGRWGQISGGLRAERILSSYVGQKHDMGLGIIELQAAIDTQDRTPFPNRGYYFSLLYQSSGRYLTSDASYTKTDWKGDGFMEIFHRHVLGLHFQWGVADATVPHSEKFRLGGQNSLLGLHEGELVGNARLMAGISYRFDLISRILADAYISGYYNTGNVWNGAEYSIRPEQFFQGIGASFTLNTLLGPITITYGHLIPAQGYKETDMIYFSAGHKF